MHIYIYIQIDVYIDIYMYIHICISAFSFWSVVIPRLMFMARSFGFVILFIGCCMLYFVFLYVGYCILHV